LFENFREHSLKQDLSNDTTVNPSLFSLVNTFNNLTAFPFISKPNVCQAPASRVFHFLSSSAHDGAAWLSMVWRGSLMVRRGSLMVRRGSVWCSVAQLVARRLAVRQARVRFSARHHREGLPTELSSDEEMERGPSVWRLINVLYE
jgi:hypothetical protein